MTTKEQLEQDHREFADEFATDRDDPGSDPDADANTDPLPDLQSDPDGDEWPGGDPLQAEGEGSDDAQGFAREASYPPGAAPQGSQTDGGATALSGDPARDAQRLRSWEGRLRVRERELEQRETALAAVLATLQAAEMGQAGHPRPGPRHLAAGGLADGQNPASARPEDDPLDRDCASAEQLLAREYGADFVQLLRVITAKRARDMATHAAAQHLSHMGAVGEALASAIHGLEDDRLRDHFEALGEAHPDFEEVADSPHFHAWIAALPGDAREEAQAAAEGGSTRAVIQLLNDYKAARGGADPRADAAEGVRSSHPGMRLPKTPARADDDYAAAWSALPD